MHQWGGKNTGKSWETGLRGFDLYWSFPRLELLTGKPEIAKSLGKRSSNPSMCGSEGSL